MAENEVARGLALKPARQIYEALRERGHHVRVVARRKLIHVYDVVEDVETTDSNAKGEEK
jgi:hypothetical protein